MTGMLPGMLSWLTAAVWAVAPWAGAGADVTVGIDAAAGMDSAAGLGAAVVCVNSEAPEYYSFEMVTTKNVPGTARLTGTASVTFAPSPFGVSVSPDGSYALDVHLSFDNLRDAPGGGVWAVWLTKSDLSEISFAGVLTPGEAFSGRASWNKFLAIVTLEDPAHVSGDAPPARWAGPVVTRGMSRSGMMHTMAGHGPFQEENCAAYGYGG